MKQKILDMKDEIENNKASRSKDSVRRHRPNTRTYVFYYIVYSAATLCSLIWLHC